MINVTTLMYFLVDCSKELGCRLQATLFCVYLRDRICRLNWYSISLCVCILLAICIVVVVPQNHNTGPGDTELLIAACYLHSHCTFHIVRIKSDSLLVLGWAGLSFYLWQSSFSLGLIQCAVTELITSFAENQDSYNNGEDITINCDITSDEAISIGFDMKW